MASNYVPLRDRQAMIAELNRRLASRPAAKHEIFIFVHGYNNNFAEGLFRNAQIVHDYDVSSVPVHFSWASAAAFTRYLYDRDSAIIARRGLAETLELAAQTNANGIVIVGHSMGAVVVMEALRTLSGDKRTDVLKRIKGYCSRRLISIPIFSAGRSMISTTCRSHSRLLYPGAIGLWIFRAGWPEERRG